MTSTVPSPHRRRARRAAPLAAVLVAAVLVLLGAPAGAQDAGSGWARVGHFAPAQGPVDLRIDGELIAEGASFRDVSDYVPLPAGTHRFSIRTAGAGPDVAPLLEVEAGVPADGAVTVAAVSARDGLAGQVYDDALRPPAAGQALVRFIHASPEVAAVDIGVVDGPTLVSDVAYPMASDYVPVAAGTYDVSVRASADEAEIIRVADWTAAAGSQSTVVVVEGLDGQPDVVPILDSGGTASTPVGGLATGFGGLADPSPGTGPASPFVLATVGAALAALLGLVLLRHRPRGAPRRPAAVLALGGMAGLALAGCGASPATTSDTVRGTTTTVGPPAPTTAPTATDEAPAASSPAPTEAPVRSGANVNAPSDVGVPTEVVIPSIGVASPLVHLGVAADGTAEVPADPQRAGWFTGGPRPGDAGPAVISGHVDTRDGPAVFARLSELAPGDEVEVRTDAGSTRFLVDRTDQVAKDAFPTEAVYGPAPGHQLRLITCGGTFDHGTGHYVDNVVVFLREVGG